MILFDDQSSFFLMVLPLYKYSTMKIKVAMIVPNVPKKYG